MQRQARTYPLAVRRQSVLISSGYRSPDLNAAVGSAGSSAHLYGCAADFTIPGFGSVEDVCHAIKPHLAEFGIRQLIDESGGGASGSMSVVRSRRARRVQPPQK